MPSGNAYKGRNLKRMELSYGGTTIKFAINPEDYTQKEPNRVNITQTKGGAWIDAWGAGIVELSIKGITGVHSDNGDIDGGYNRWIELRNLFRKVFEAIKDGEEVKELIKFYNFTDNEYFYCYPMQSGIELYRSKARPHVYQYSINLWAIRKIGEPASSTGAIGNPNKPTTNTTNKGKETVTNKTTESKPKGGNNVATRNLSLDTEVDVSTVTNTRTKTIIGIQEDCLTYAEALRPIVGGKNGKISPVTGVNCVKGIFMQSTGTISNVNPFSGKDISDVDSRLLDEIRFVSKVSLETYQLYSKIKDYSTDVLSYLYTQQSGISARERVIQAAYNSKVYDSTIYEYIVEYQPKYYLTKSEINMLKVILLESMMVYQSLYDIYEQNEEDLTSTLTSTNMKILINNIKAVIFAFTIDKQDKTTFYKQNVAIELRKLEKIITQICADIIDYL